jgi:hypothetical protein
MNSKELNSRLAHANAVNYFLPPREDPPVDLEVPLEDLTELPLLLLEEDDGLYDLEGAE